MGEIADALRIARGKKAKLEKQETPAAESPPGDVAAALRRAEPAAERTRAPEPPPARERPPEVEGPRASAPPREPAADTGPLENRPVTLPEPTLQDRLPVAVEAGRRLAIRMRELLDGRGIGSLAIVSSVRGEGKTTVSCEIALALAALHGGRDVALIDLDLRRPSLRSRLGATSRVGVEQVLLGRASLEDARVVFERPGLDVYPVKEPRSDAHDLLVSSRLPAVLEELKRRYGTVLIDTPPTLIVPDVNLILRHIDGCVAIAREGVTRARSFKRMLESLPNTKVLGYVLNEARVATEASYDYYYAGEPKEGGQAAAAGKARWALSGWKVATR